MTTLIEKLNNPDSFSDKTNTVSIVQTHISMVFITDNFVYKIKKPVNFDFLDFSTLEKRQFFCHQEVDLNRRLSKDIYLGVLPVLFDGQNYTIGEEGRGDVVDYAVKMRRVPEEMLMNSVFKRGELSRKHLERVAETLASFHKEAQTSKRIAQFGSPDRFKVNTDENFEQVQKYVGIAIKKSEFEQIQFWTNNFYNKNKALFFQRIKDGRIRDCHGDLHMEHICLTEDLSVIDCIEFNERFRYSDTVADIAFLLMDLEYHGGRCEASILWQLYKERAGEDEVDSLLCFYKVYRAFVRGKVNSFQLDDEGIGEDKQQEAVERARKYFGLAGSYIDI